MEIFPFPLLCSHNRSSAGRFSCHWAADQTILNRIIILGEQVCFHFPIASTRKKHLHFFKWFLNMEPLLDNILCLFSPRSIRLFTTNLFILNCWPARSYSIFFYAILFCAHSSPEPLWRPPWCECSAPTFALHPHFPSVNDKNPTDIIHIKMLQLPHPHNLVTWKDLNVYWS